MEDEEWGKIEDAEWGSAAVKCKIHKGSGIYDIYGGKNFLKFHEKYSHSGPNVSRTC